MVDSRPQDDRHNRGTSSFAVAVIEIIINYFYNHPLQTRPALPRTYSYRYHTIEWTISIAEKVAKPFLANSGHARV